MRESRTSGTLPHFASTGNRYLRILAARCLRAGSVEPSLRPEQTSSGPFCGSRSPFSDDPGCARLDLRPVARLVALREAKTHEAPLSTPKEGDEQ